MSTKTLGYVPCWKTGNASVRRRSAPCRLAFPAISTGIYRYPLDQATTIAVAAVRSTPTAVTIVRFVCFDEPTANAYEAALSSSHPV